MLNISLRRRGKNAGKGGSFGKTIHVPTTNVDLVRQKDGRRGRERNLIHPKRDDVEDPSFMKKGQKKNPDGAKKVLRCRYPRDKEEDRTGPRKNLMGARPKKSLGSFPTLGGGK